MKKKLCGNCPAHDLQARIEELMEERRDLYKQVQEYARCISLEQSKNKKLEENIVWYDGHVKELVLNHKKELKK